MFSHYRTASATKAAKHGEGRNRKRNLFLLLDAFWNDTDLVPKGPPKKNVLPYFYWMIYLTGFAETWLRAARIMRFTIMPVLARLRTSVNDYAFAPKNEKQRLRCINLFAFCKSIR
jgi:hypothetical protein